VSGVLGVACDLHVDVRMTNAGLMSFEDRVQSVTRLGFTPRQAAFLVTVMLHAGVCIGRHYCDFAGIAPGQRMHEFFRHLIGGGYAIEHRPGRNRATLYHIHNKRLYQAIGEPDHRHRHTPAPANVSRRLMLLDAVLADPDVRWLATIAEKVACVTTLTNLPPHALPCTVGAGGGTPTTRYFPDQMPFGMRARNNDLVFLYVVDDPWPGRCCVFLHRHAALLSAVPRWTLRIALPAYMKAAESEFHRVAVRELTAGLSPSTFDELRWYFEQRQRGAEHVNRDIDERYQRAGRAFSSPQYGVLYRLWQHDGEAALTPLRTRPLAAALSNGTAQIETQTLPHGYLYLRRVGSCSPLGEGKRKGPSD
jgi:hypothetical protein